MLFLVNDYTYNIEIICSQFKCYVFGTAFCEKAVFLLHVFVKKRFKTYTPSCHLPQRSPQTFSSCM